MSDIVVSTAWLADHLEDPSVRVLDVREAWEYEGIGHVPGAVNVPFDSFRAEEGGEAGMLPGAGAFADLLGEAGVSNEDHLVAYDDTHGVFAARLLVTAELYGHPRERLHLLDGDFSAWQRDGPVSTDAPPVDPTDYHAEYDPSGPLVEMETVEAALSDEGTVIVDTREQAEYEAGHLPGAVRLDWRELVDSDSRGLGSDEETRTLLESRGISPERRVLLYCNTARRISHTYVVLRHLGYEDLAFYEGSLTEWEREGGELVTGGRDERD